MGPSPSADPALTAEESELLLDLAEVAIRACLDGTHYPGPDLTLVPPVLQRPCSAFVTLHVAGELNGCIGNIGGTTPVGACVVELAIQAAFNDPRLPPLCRADLARLHIEISLLSARTPIPAATREELLEHLEPRVHGLILSASQRRAVFLPTVWDQLRHPHLFVDQLLAKAGLPTSDWPSDMEAHVFTTTTIGRHVQ